MNQTTDNRRPMYFTAAELAELGADQIPDIYAVTSHLVFSSPATLAYNSPGAEGFGVKRAGLAVPDSVMLIVSPGCCGRNTSQISSMPQYHNRFFYLDMNETDLVTGRHLKMIPDAVCEIVESLPKRPSLVMICATCVDALLGTDWDRVARAAEKKSGVLVRPCYMYALTREGRKPPMVHVRQSLYSLLEKTERNRKDINLLGFFAPLCDDSELYEYLQSAGAGTVRELSRCESFEAFMQMSGAGFNIVLNPECRAAADDLSERLGMPYVELKRFYDPERIHRQYEAFFKVLGVKADGDEKGNALFALEKADFEKTEEHVKAFHEKYSGLKVSIGETLNADPFELALALARRGACVQEVFATVTAESMPYISRLAAISPETRFYCNQDPTMLFYGSKENGPDLTLGKDAAIYHPGCRAVHWNQDVQPFGYAGLRNLYTAMEAALETEPQKTMPLKTACSSCGRLKERSPERPLIHGFRKHLTPFAPDQSGAVSVFYALGGLVVIVDAGGCTGNVCGFDEPRWLSSPGGHVGAVFSAGLRDMDAILGRDDLLVKKLQEAAEQIRPAFIALVGTPVPAVIATDFRALKRMAEKKTSLPVVTVASSGMSLYDKGIEEALLELFQAFPGEAPDTAAGEKLVGVLGFTPMDFDLKRDSEKLRQLLAEEHAAPLFYGTEGGIETIRRAPMVSRNLVVSPAGLAAAKFLEKKYGTPYEIGWPAAPDEAAARMTEQILQSQKIQPEKKKLLIVHQQVRANALRNAIRAEKAESGMEASVKAASWFMMIPELMEEGDLQLREEEEFRNLVLQEKFDLVIADPVLKELVPEYDGEWIDAVHFAVSGQLPGGAA